MAFRLVVIVIFLSIKFDATNAQVSFQKFYDGLGADIVTVDLVTTGGYLVMNGKTLRIDINGDTIWTKGYNVGNHVKCALQTMDKGYVICGDTEFPTTISNVFLSKMDSAGNLLWSKMYGDTDYSFISSIIQTTDSGFMLAGTYRGGPSLDSDAYLIKTDQFGNLLWAKTIGSSGDETAYSVIQRIDGGFIFGGTASLFGIITEAFYLVKLNNSGVVQWSKVYDGVYSEGITSMKQIGDGGIIILGFSSGIPTVSNVATIILKTDSVGNSIWSKYYSDEDVASLAIEQTSDDGFIITGVISGSNFQGNDVLLIKTNPLGDTLWTRSYGGAGTEIAHSVKQTLDGGFVIGAISLSASNGALIIKTDSLGNSFCYEYPASVIVNDSLMVEVSVQSNVRTIGTERNYFPTEVFGTAVIPLCFTNNEHEISKQNIIAIYPNPTNEKLSVDFGEIGNHKTELRICDITGKVVLVKRFAQENRTVVDIDVSELSSGIYLVQLMEEGIRAKLFVKN